MAGACDAQHKQPPPTTSATEWPTPRRRNGAGAVHSRRRLRNREGAHGSAACLGFDVTLDGSEVTYTDFDENGNDQSRDGHGRLEPAAANRSPARSGGRADPPQWSPDGSMIAYWCLCRRAASRSSSCASATGYRIASPMSRRTSHEGAGNPMNVRVLDQQPEIRLPLVGSVHRYRNERNHDDRSRCQQPRGVTRRDTDRVPVVLPARRRDLVVADEHRRHPPTEDPTSELEQQLPEVVTR